MWVQHELTGNNKERKHVIWKSIFSSVIFLINTLARAIITCTEYQGFTFTFLGLGLISWLCIVLGLGLDNTVCSSNLVFFVFFSWYYGFIWQHCFVGGFFLKKVKLCYRVILLVVSVFKVFPREHFKNKQ